MSNRLPVLVVEIIAAHDGAQHAARMSLEHAAKAGALLLEAKAAVPHGQWRDWMRSNITFSEPTAQIYMRLARHHTADETKNAATADF